jgi:hypothetical protein
MGAFGTTVSISCSPGAAMFVATVPEGIVGHSTPTVLKPETLDSDGVSKSGSSISDSIATSWRRITLEFGDYLELMVRW